MSTEAEKYGKSLAFTLGAVALFAGAYIAYDFWPSDNEVTAFEDPKPAIHSALNQHRDDTQNTTGAVDVAMDSNGDVTVTPRNDSEISIISALAPNADACESFIKSVSSGEFGNVLTYVVGQQRYPSDSSSAVTNGTAWCKGAFIGGKRSATIQIEFL